MNIVRTNRGISILFWALTFCSSWTLAACGPSTGPGASAAASDDDDDDSDSGGGGGGGGGGGYYDPPVVYTADFDFPVETAISAPTALASGDFDNDGVTDVLVLSNSADTIRPFMGDSGFFTAGTSISIASGTASGLITGDWNNDGYWDFAATNADDLIVGLGAGDGTFAVATRDLAVAAASGLVAVDITNDGFKDMVIWDETSTASLIEIVPNNGSGSFTAASVSRSMSSTEVTGVLGVDTDDDDDLDVVFVAGGDTLFGVFENTEDPDDLVSTSYFQQSLAANANAFVAGDIDSDGDVDLIFQGSTQHYLATNNGFGTFTVAAAGPASSNAYAGLALTAENTIVAGENDSSSGDEMIWLITYDGSDFDSTGVSYGLIGNATLSKTCFLLVGDALVVNDGNYLSYQPSVESPVHVGGSAGYVSGSPSTLTGTGYGDSPVLLTLGNDEVHVYAPSSTGLTDCELDSDAETVSQNTVISLGSAAAISLGMADFDSDGDDDFAVTASSTSLVHKARNQADGTLGWDSYATGTTPTKVAFGDVDGDSNLEMATVNASNVSIFTDNAGSATNVSISSPIDLLFGDVDGDGDEDLVIAKGNDTLTYIAGTGSALGSSETALFSTSASLKGIVAVGNLDGDESDNPDVIAFSATKLLLRKRGDSSWASEETITVSATETIKQVRHVDVTGDGDKDLVVGSVDADSNGKVRIYIGDGNMNYSLYATYYTVSGLLGLAVGDYSGSPSAKPDIVVYNASGVYLVGNTGTGD